MRLKNADHSAGRSKTHRTGPDRTGHGRRARAESQQTVGRAAWNSIALRALTPDAYAVESVESGRQNVQRIQAQLSDELQSFRWRLWGRRWRRRRRTRASRPVHGCPGSVRRRGHTKKTKSTRNEHNAKM